MENLKYTQKRLILTNTVIKNILIIRHAIVLLICSASLSFPSSKTRNQTLLDLLSRLEENLVSHKTFKWVTVTVIECRWAGTLRNIPLVWGLQGLIGDGGLPRPSGDLFPDSIDIHRKYSTGGHNDFINFSPLSQNVTNAKEMRPSATAGRISEMRNRNAKSNATRCVNFEPT
jgi:hypothetical protein